MRTAWVVGVTAAHVAVVTGLMMQGCGTVREPVVDDTVVPMPPRFKRIEEVDPLTAASVVGPTVPEAKVWEASETTIYKVRKGESLSRIAHRYGLALADIIALNDIDNPNMVRSGQRLILPGQVDLSTPASAPTVSQTTMKVPTGGTQYVVQRGDCVSVIAKKFGVTSKALRRANSLKGDAIFVDQKLVIPAGGSPVAEPVGIVAPTLPDRTPLPPAIDETPDLGGAPVVEPPVAAPMMDQPMGSPVVVGRGRLHKVTAGQSLLAIASEWNVSIDALRSANPWLNEKEPSQGDELVIPPPEA
jgi:LysM repeat protein